MAIANLSVHAHSRSKHRCWAELLGYRLGCDLTDATTGKRHYYSRRGLDREVVITGFCHGPTKPAWEPGAQATADVFEGAETRCNSIVAREAIVALPHELTFEEAVNATIDLTQQICDSYNTVAAFALHPSDSRGDGRNWHAHILFGTRSLDPETGLPGKKLREFHIRSRAPARHRDSAREQARTDSGGASEVKKLRARWEGIANSYLENAGRPERIAMGRVNDPRDRRPILTIGEVAAERQLWDERNPTTTLDKRPMSVVALVIRNYQAGGCKTQKGRLLVEHMAMQRPEKRPHAGYHEVSVPDLEPNEIEAAIAESQADIQPLAPHARRPRKERARRRRRRRRTPTAATAPEATPADPLQAPPSPGPALTAAPGIDAQPAQTAACPTSTRHPPRAIPPTLAQEPTLTRTQAQGPTRQATTALRATPAQRPLTRPTPPRAPQVTLQKTAPRPTRWRSVARPVRAFLRQLQALPTRLMAALTRAAAPAPLRHPSQPMAIPIVRHAARARPHQADLNRATAVVEHHQARLQELLALHARYPTEPLLQPGPAPESDDGWDLAESIVATAIDDVALEQAQQEALDRWRRRTGWTDPPRPRAPERTPAPPGPTIAPGRPR